ncbi:MAG: pyridoxamine kinase [Blautia sp.]|nr:pyridoxamine kinase [Blautia sp.]
MKKAAVINDLSGFGKCSLTAALPVLSALGVQCCPLATAVLTGQTGYPHYYCTDLTDMLPRYTSVWEQNGAHFDSIYTGFLTGSGQIGHVLDFLAHFRENGTLLLVDPVMGDDGRVYTMYSDGLLAGMKELSRQADLITPNLTEACLLADIPIERIRGCKGAEQTLALAKSAAEILRSMAAVPQDVVITGIKCRRQEQPLIYNLSLTPDGAKLCQAHFFDCNFSGTGDLFSSVMCGCRTQGMPTADAAELATRFLSHSIEDTMKDSADRNDGVNFELHLLELIDGIRRLQE